MAKHCRYRFWEKTFPGGLVKRAQDWYGVELLTWQADSDDAKMSTLGYVTNVY